MNPLHTQDGLPSLIGVERTGLSMILLLNLFDRLQCGICGDKPLPSRKLIEAAQSIDPGYCLDAPESLPSGGMANFEVPPCGDDDPPMWLPEMMTCEREPAP